MIPYGQGFSWSLYWYLIWCWTCKFVKFYIFLLCWLLSPLSFYLCSGIHLHEHGIGVFSLTRAEFKTTTEEDGPFCSWWVNLTVGGCRLALWGIWNTLPNSLNLCWSCIICWMPSVFPSFRLSVQKVFQVSLYWTLWILRHKGIWIRWNSSQVLGLEDLVNLSHLSFRSCDCVKARPCPDLAWDPSHIIPGLTFFPDLILIFCFLKLLYVQYHHYNQLAILMA